MKSRKLISGLLAATMLLSAAAPGGLIPQAQAARVNTLGDGLVLYSTFDEGDARDLSGNGHNGTVVGGIQFVEGVSGKSIQLPSTVGSYVKYGKSINIIPDKENFSLSLWYKDTGDTHNGTLVGSKDYNNGSYRGIAIGTYDNSTMRDIRVNFAATGKVSTAGTRIELKGADQPLLKMPQDGDWHHLAVSFDRAGNMTCYVDGVYAGALPISSQRDTIDVGLDLVLGADGNYKNGLKNAVIDEFRVYDRVISADEAKELYDLNKPPFDMEQGLLLHSSFDASDVDGSTVKDLSGNNHNGAVVGPVQFVPGISGNAVKITGQRNVGSDTAAGDRYVNYGASKDIVPGTGNFSISMWFRPDGTAANNSSLLGTKAYSNAANQGLVIGTVNNELVFNVADAGKTAKEMAAGKKPADYPLMLGKTSDNMWHHLVCTFDRAGNMVAYVDNVKVGVLSISDKAASIDAGLNLVLGAGGNFMNAANNCYFDELRLYSGVLPASGVEALYNECAETAAVENARLRLEKVKAELERMEPSTTHSQQLIDDFMTDVAGWIAELSVQGLTLAQAMEIVARFEEGYQSFQAGATPLASFHLVSDVHIPSSSESSTEAANYKAAMENMKSINPDTTIAFVNAGDFTNNSSKEEYEGFYNLTAKYNPVSDEKTLIIQGNHDVRGVAGSGEANWNKDPRQPEKCVYWNTAKALYQEHNARYMNGSADTLYHSKELGGYTFIMLNTELGLKDAMYMSAEQLAWFEQTMAEAYAKDPSKPIFIVSHQPLNDTHWLGNVMDGFDGILANGTPQPYQTGADAKVKEIMAKYPNGILLSGHIHNEFGRAEAVVRPYGVTVDLPSFGQGGINTSEKGTGYEVQIYGDAVVFRALNYATGEWYPQYDVTVSMPTAAAAYQQAETILTTDERDYYSREDISKLKKSLAALDNLVSKTYDQSALKWNSTETAPVQFYQSADHNAINEAAYALTVTLSGLTRFPEPRPDTTFEVLRDNWRAYLLGGTGDDLDLANPAVAAYVEGLNADAAEYWNSMVKSSTPNRDDLWLDLDMTPINDYSNEAYTRSGNMATTFTRLRAIANAWGTVGCDFYHNDYVRDELVKALDYLMTSYFLYGEEGYGNWYHWEITAPTALMNITMVLYDELTQAQIATYTKNAKWYVPYCDKGGPNSNGPAMTGGNLLLKANAAAQIGILSEDEGLLDNVKAGVKKVLVYNDYGTFYKSDADGFYADGSYIQHQALAYIGGYGADLYNNLGVFLNTLNGSEWEIKYEDQSEKIAYDFVFNGIEPFLYETCTMDMVSSRDITRNGSTDRGRTSRILSALMPLRGTFPTMEQNTRFDSMMKYYLSQDPYYYYSHMSSITSIQMAAELVNDSSVRPRQGYTLTKTFAMDKTVHITPDFGFAVSMHSSRTYGHELINNEGKRTWNTSDGMFYLYDADESQYGGGYWATVDPTRLPGTTAEHTVFNNGDGDRTKNIYDWTGGASLDSFGAAGTHIRTLGTPGSDARNGTDVKKSYFMFGDRIVMMGSGITSSTGNEVETIVDNRKLLLDGSNAITVDGAAADLTDTPAALENPDWLHVAGNVPGADVGYYFPADITVQALKETRTGNWKDQGDTSGTATNTFATFYVNHGAKPRNATYEYVLLPGMTAGETAAYAAAPDVEILQNDASIHAARDNTNGVVAANFWDNRTATVAGITVDRAASVVMQTTGNTVTMAVADPTQQDKIITVSLATAGELISADPNVSVVQTEPFLMFRVDTAKLGGGSSMATFEMVPAERLELVSTVTQLAPITVEANTPFLLLPLPETAVFMANDMQEHTLPIIWTRNGYLTSPYGEYTVIATPVLGDRYLNGAGVSLQVSVLVNGGSPQQLAECDTYVNDGKYADDVMGGGGTATGIPVKQDDPGYYRKALFRIDITGVPTDCDEVYFTFQVSVPLDSGFLGAELYQVSNDWDQSAVTWNTIPGRTGEKPAASFKPGDVSADGVVQLNVTATVKAAQAAGLEAISFELTAVGGRNGGKNQMTVQTLESDAAQKPALNWDIVQTAAAADKSNLKMLVEFAKELDAAQFSNYNETAFRDAIAAAQAVLDDKNAGIDQVNDAEDVLLRLLLALRVKPLPIV